MTDVPKLNKVEALKKAKDSYDVLSDLLTYSQSRSFDSIQADAEAKADLEVRFRWYGVYQQKPNEGNFMLRIKVPGGQLTPGQLRTLAEIATRYGRGFSDITTRQDIQFHWLTLPDLQPVFQALWDAGLTTQFACGDCPRNIVSCPLSGVLKNELLDTTGLAQQISAMYNAGGREFSNLPRKFKPSIGACPDFCWLPHINDFAFYAVQHPADPARLGFALMVGGGLSDSPLFAQPLRAFVTPEQVLPVARAIAVLFRDHGYREKRGRARLKFLVADRGWEWTRTTLESILGFALDHQDSLQFPPIHGTDHLGVGLQKDGNHFLGLAVERGRWSADQMKLVADLADRFATGPKRIRLTVRQNALMLNVPRSNLAPLSKELENAGLPPVSHPLRSTLVACTGSQFCNLAVVETKDRASRVLHWLEQNLPDLDQPVQINFSGCPNSCSHYQIADIGMTGIPVLHPHLRTPEGKPAKVDGYNILLGGILGSHPQFAQLTAKKIPADLIHLSIKNLLDHYLTGRAHDGETFHQWVTRGNPDELQKIITDPIQSPQAQPLAL